MDIFWILLIVAVAALIKGMTGFGFALITLPLLMFWYSPKELIPILVLCNLISSIFIVLQKKDRKLVNAHFQSLLLYGGFFTIAGVLVLHYVSENSLIFVMSIFFILLSIFSLIGFNIQLKLKAFYYKLAGAFCGFLTGCISVSGPPLAIFLHATDTSNQEFREIFSWFSIVTASIAMVGYFYVGLFTMDTIKMTLQFLPILFLGAFLGKKLNNIIPTKLFGKISLIMSLVSSVILLLNMN